MARMEISIEGFDKRGASTGKAMRVLNSATSKAFIMDNVAQVKGAIRVGQCGRHVIRLKNENGRVLERVDHGRRGTIAATIGKFKELASA